MSACSCTQRTVAVRADDPVLDVVRLARLAARRGRPRRTVSRSSGWTKREERVGRAGELSSANAEDAVGLARPRQSPSDPSSSATQLPMCATSCAFSRSSRFAAAPLGPDRAGDVAIGGDPPGDAAVDRWGATNRSKTRPSGSERCRATRDPAASARTPSRHWHSRAADDQRPGSRRSRGRPVPRRSGRTPPGTPGCSAPLVGRDREGRWDRALPRAPLRAVRRSHRGSRTTVHRNRRVVCSSEGRSATDGVRQYHSTRTKKEERRLLSSLPATIIIRK